MSVQTPLSTQENLKQAFSEIEIDYSWSFSGKTRKDTGYATHAYHSYPAKFIPQVAARLIEKYSYVGDTIVDPFTGSGTTLVEAKLMGRKSIGTDINPVATLISSVKLNAIEPLKLATAILTLQNRMGLFDETMTWFTHNHERIDYWFRPEEKNRLSFLYHEISQIKDVSLQRFFFCAFSNILKSCSIWMQKSNKPTRDMKKTPAEPFKALNRQLKAMSRGNLTYYNLLKEKGYLEETAAAYCQDARECPTENDSVDLVVTSPPYVTSYEYADLHQLATLWLNYSENLTEFRKQFIGTAYHESRDVILHSQIADEIFKTLNHKHKKSALAVANYFGEMYEVFEEMARVLKVGGKICIVIGNTTLRKVDILNAEVFAEQLQDLGFKFIEIIKREIPSKNLPSVRDETTGRFAKLDGENLTYAYPTEYILVMGKE